MTEASFTCPRCGRTSWNANDVREGYCGACHDWTRESTARRVADEDRAGGRNTITRFADADLCTPPEDVR